MSTPDPLVPHFVDLTDYPDMPLEVARLRDSSLVAQEDGEVFRGAVLLWAAAWHQRPAASVPNDDSWLASVCGFKSRAGVDPKWTEIRERCLRGFVLCSDGRLYHDVLAAKAITAWQSKLQHRWKRMYDRTRHRNKIRAISGDSQIVIPDFEAFVASGCIDPEPPTGFLRKSGAKGREEKGSKEGAPTSSPLPPRVRASHTRARARAKDEVDPKPKASKRCPPSFEISSALREWAAITTPGIDLELELGAMKDHEFAKTRSDWEATFRNWLRTAFKRTGPARTPASNSRHQTPASNSRHQTPAERRATTAANLTRHRTKGAPPHDDDPRPNPPDEEIVDVAARFVDDDPEA